MCFPLRSFHPLGGERKEKKKDWRYAKEGKKINFLAAEDLVKMKHLSHEMDANTTQRNTNKVLS